MKTAKQKPAPPDAAPAPIVAPPVVSPLAALRASECCAGCRFYFLREPQAYGRCRRFPPSGIGPDYPVAMQNNWCGEFQRRIE